MHIEIVKWIKFSPKCKNILEVMEMQDMIIVERFKDLHRIKKFKLPWKSSNANAAISDVECYSCALSKSSWSKSFQ